MNDLHEISIVDLLDRITTTLSHDDLWALHSVYADDLQRLATHYAWAWSAYLNQEQLAEDLRAAVTIELFSDVSKTRLKEKWEKKKQSLGESESIEQEQAAQEFVHSYLKTTTSRVGKRITRESSRLQTSALDEAIDYSVNQWPTFSEMMPEVREALDALSPEDRSLIWERFVEEKSISEIAEERRISYSTAATRVFRAKERMRKRLGKCPIDC